MKAGELIQRLGVTSALVVIGLGLAAGGTFLIAQQLRTRSDVDLGLGVRNGGLTPSEADLLAAAAHLEKESGGGLTADEGTALTFLRYEAGLRANARGDTGQGRQQLLAAERAAEETLAQSPTRGDVALALAELRSSLGEDPATAKDALAYSYLVAPRELWIIERRIWLDLQFTLSAGPALKSYIIADIVTLGEPHRSTDNYRILARAAYAAGPGAIVLVRQTLAGIPDGPVQIFDSYVQELARSAHP